MAGTLHVYVKTAYEAECADEGGADRLILTGRDPDLTPEPDTVVKVRRASSVHLRVLLRLRPGYITDGGEMTRLKGLAFAFREAGADGFVFSFLNALSEIDLTACRELAGDDTWGWTFDRAIDAALDQEQAWSELAGLPRVDSVLSAGSAREVEYGLDRLIARAHGPVPVVAAGGLRPDHVPWLARGGVDQYAIPSSPAGAGAIRAWRRLIDDEVGRVRH